MTLPFLSSDVNMVTSFQDADPMGIVYHGNYFRFFEEARRVLMEKIDYGYRAMESSGFIWPVIDVHVRYIHAIPYNQLIRVTAHLTEWENRLKVDYVIYHGDTGKRLSKGYTMQVAVSIESKEMQLEAPDVLKTKLQTYWLTKSAFAPHEVVNE